MTQTIFEQFLDALLEGGHEIHFHKHKGTICMILKNCYELSAISGVTLEQIGQIGIEGAISSAYKNNPDQGGAGDTRIDGGDEC